MIRAFLAIDLPDAVRHRLSLLQYLLPLPNPVEEEALHLTLSFLGEQPDPVLESVHEALTALHLPQFTLTIKGVGLFGGAKPRLAYAAVQPDQGLLYLQTKVETAARRAGVPIASQRYVPHITLGRFKAMPTEAVMELERALVEHAAFHCDPFPVTRFSLFSSYSGPKGGWYENLADYPLSPG